jgi:hypothetical protein
MTIATCARLRLANLSARLRSNALSFRKCIQPEPLPTGWKIRNYFNKVPLPGVLASAAAATLPPHAVYTNG